MKTEKLVGRALETAEIQQCIKSCKSEFVVLYGRRRVGKTFLVKKFFKGRFDFLFVGVSRMTSKQQLETFASSLSKYADHRIETPQNWTKALDLLSQYLERFAPVYS
ncbi:MAG: ATP-binding protein [Bacteroidales bacterium]|nr:ATP-binding protein [Bacteroidales bacterium]